MSILANSSSIVDQTVIEEEEEEEVLPSFDLVELDDDPVNSSAALRAARILKSRQAATNYKAKVEEPGWYFEAKPTIKGSPRIEMFSIHQLYLQRSYSEALRIGLECIKRVKSGADFVEILDLVMRSSLKCEEEISLEIIQIARKYHSVRKAHPGLSYSVALVLSSAPSSLNVPKLEALEASLVAVSSRKATPYHSLAMKLLKETGNEFLATFLQTPLFKRWDGVEDDEIDRVISSVGVSNEGKETLIKMAGKRDQQEEEEEVVRDVRSL